MFNHLHLKNAPGRNLYNPNEPYPNYKYNPYYYHIHNQKPNHLDITLKSNPQP